MRTTVRHLVVLGAVTTAVALAVSGCSGASGGSGSGSSEFTFWGLSDTAPPVKTLRELAKGACSDEVGKTTLKTDVTSQNEFDQKVQLQAGQDALPNALVTPSTPALTKQLIKSGQLVNLSEKLKDAGLSDEILPAAASVIQTLYGSKDLYALPHELNIEGIWYNKKIFTDEGLTPPSTWDELLSVSDALMSKGVQPIAVAGKDGWPLTRWVGNYLFRSLGPDAMKDVADGKAKLTDPDYVKAAQEVSDLGKSGAFGKNVASNDYNGALNDFLTGKAAMYYMGSWALSAFNDPKQDEIGVENIGIIPFPTVAGGKGTVDEIPANVGQPMVFGSSAWGSSSEAWLKCIATKYGDQVASKDGVISGFVLHDDPKLPPLSKQVQETALSAKSSLLWFEALFNAQATEVSSANAGLLGSGAQSGA